MMKRSDIVKKRKPQNENNRNGNAKKKANKNTNLSRDEMRLLKKKKMRRKRIIRKVILSFFLAVCVTAVGVALAYTVFFKISSVEIKGNEKYPKKTVLNYCGVKNGDSLLSVNEDRVMQALKEKLPYIGGVEITKKLPSQLIITVTELKEVAAYANNGRYILLDGDGRILNNNATLLKGNVALIKGISDISGENGEIFSSESKSRKPLLKILKCIDELGIKGITQIDVKKTSDIILKYDSRITIKLGNTLDLENKMKKCKVVIEKENKISKTSKGTLDLRSDSYSYFKVK